MRIMKKLTLIASCVALLLSSCAHEYNQVLKSGDYTYKYEYAKQSYAGICQQRCRQLPAMLLAYGSKVVGKCRQPYHLVSNIQKRGRDYEQQIPLDYLQGLNTLYEEFIYQKYKGKVLVIDVDNIDFEHNPKEFGAILDQIDANLFGLFSKEDK